MDDWKRDPRPSCYRLRRAGGAKSSPTDTPSAPAMDSSVVKVGLALPSSMSDIRPCRRSPASAASRSWDQSRSLRSLRTLCASAFRSDRAVPLAIDDDGSSGARFIYAF
jgi:hypothetical protein